MAATDGQNGGQDIRALLAGRRAANDGDLTERPLYSRALGETICERLRVGIPLRFCASFVHVRESLVRKWYMNGYADRENGYETPFSEFADMVDTADAEYVASAIARIRLHGQEDWRAEAWLLERRHRLEFGGPRQAAAQQPPAEQQAPPQGDVILVVGEPADGS